MFLNFFFFLVSVVEAILMYGSIVIFEINPGILIFIINSAIKVQSKIVDDTPVFFLIFRENMTWHLK